jgi:threonine/homoserine/homoserine lactone efflux protein
MGWHGWILFVMVETMLCLAPGPAVLLVVSQGLSFGWRGSIAANLGILAGNAVYFALSATGLGAVLLASWDLFFAIKWIGAAYLVWLGLGAFFGRGEGATPAPAGARPAAPLRRFRNGMVLQLANPKALLFFAALLPQFIDPAGAVARQVAILGVTSVAIEFVVLACYGGLAGRARLLAGRPRFARLVDRLSGLLLMAAGLGMALLRRT